jgi:peptidyl-prolyl cis-trans isomerase SurA
MNNFRALIFLLITFISFELLSQKAPKDDVLFTYGKNKVMVYEFERGFLKNNDITKKKPDPVEVDEYLELYKKFKLKVQEAFLLGMDTVPAFISELGGYRRQLAKPFMTDSDVTEQLVKEAYDRLKNEVHASHILIFTKPEDMPADTLKAYNRMVEIRNEVVN